MVSAKKERSSSKSLVVGVVVLAVSLSIYGLIFFLNKSKESDLKNAQANIEKTKAEMDSDAYRELYDFQSRLFELEDLISFRILGAAYLDRISEYTLPFTHFVDIAEVIEVKNRRGINVTANMIIYELRDGQKIYNQEMVARQMDAFSKMKGVKELALIESNPDENGMGIRVSFFIEDEKADLINSKKEEQ